jgi:hypothetical protein
MFSVKPLQINSPGISWPGVKIMMVFSKIREMLIDSLRIKLDIEAVENGINMPWSNGAVEGHVNRIKSIKRKMYGRASFELLRKKVILSQSGYCIRSMLQFLNRHAKSEKESMAAEACNGIFKP